MDPFWTGVAYMAAFAALIYGGALAAKWWLERRRKPPPGVLLVAMLALTMLSAPAFAGPTRATFGDAKRLGAAALQVEGAKLVHWPCPLRITARGQTPRPRTGLLF
jgi:hypothetical protein